MDPSTFLKSHPLIVLLNEIDILLAQSRLLELHIKRAQTASADRIAQLHELHQQQLAKAKAELAESERAEPAGENAPALPTELQQQLELVNRQLALARCAVETKNEELRHAEADLKGVREQMHGLEIACAAAKAETLALQSSGRTQTEAAGAEQQSELQARLAKAEDRIREAENRAREALTALDHANRENTTLHCRLAELEVFGAETQRRAADEIEKARLQFEAQVAELRSSVSAQERAARRLEAHLRDKEVEISTLSHKLALQERELTGRYEAVSAVELALHAKIQGLQQTLASSQRDIDERDQVLAVAETQIDELRRDLADASAKRMDAEEKSSALLERSAACLSSERALRQRLEIKISELQMQLAEKQLLAERRGAEIADLKENARRFTKVDLSTRNGPSEAEREQQQLQIQGAARKDEAREKEWSVARQTAAETLALGHKTQLQELKSKIEEQQRALQARESELARAHSRAENLSEQLQELRHSQSAASAFETYSREDYHIMKTGDSNPQTSDPVASPDAASPMSSQEHLREELKRLRQEAQEKNQILQDRNDELVRVKAQLDQVQERLAQHEIPAPEKTTGDSEADRMRTEFQAQLALLQAELSQKEWALQEREAQAHAMEQQLRREIEILGRRIHAESSERGLVGGGEGIDEGPEETLSLNGHSGSHGASGLFASHRRWNSGFSSKRRWRS